MAALLIGFGNQGRGDDGLGPLFAERIEQGRRKAWRSTSTTS